MEISNQPPEACTDTEAIGEGAGAGVLGSAICVTSPMKFSLVFAISTPPRRLGRRACSIPFRPRHIDDDLLRLVGQRGGTLVAHLGQLLDGTLLNFRVAVVQQLLPHDEQISSTMDLFDKLPGIIGKRNLSARDFLFLGFDFGLGFSCIPANFVHFSIRMGRRHLSVPCAVRAGRDDGACVHCSGDPASVVRRSLIPLHWDPAPLRGGRSMTVDPFAVTRTARAVVSSGMSVGLALIFLTCHGVHSCGKRVVPPRPQKSAIRRHIRKLTDDGEVGGIEGGIRPQVAACPGSLERLFRGFLRHWRALRVLMSLPEYRTPQLAFGIAHKPSTGKASRDIHIFRLLNGADRRIDSDISFVGRRASGQVLHTSFRIAPHPESENYAVRGVTMRAAKWTLRSGSTRTRNPAIPIAPVTDVSNAFHGCRDLPPLDWSLRKQLRSAFTPSALQSSRSRRWRSEEHTSELQSQSNLVCRLLLEKKKKTTTHCADWDTHEHQSQAHMRYHQAPHNITPHTATRVRMVNMALQYHINEQRLTSAGRL